MRPEQYEKVYRWFHQRPKAYRLLAISAKGLPALVVLAYVGLLLWLIGSGAPWSLWMRVVLVPAGTLVLGSLLRKWYDAPRPYEKGIRPLLPKDTKGQSCPSRHALSASVIGAVWGMVCPAAGGVMLVLTLGVCVTRVLAGVHSVWDVTAGAVLGTLCGVIGMLL